MTTLTDNYNNDVLTIDYVDENELPEALLQSIERGLKDSEDGRFITHDEMNRKIDALINSYESKWQK